MQARRRVEGSAVERAEAGIARTLAQKGLSGRCAALLAGVAGEVEREGARLRLWRFCESAPVEVLETVDARLLGALFLHTDAISERLIADPHQSLYLPEAEGPAPSRDDLLARLGPVSREPALLAKQLRRFRHRAYQRLALRDILGLDDIPALTREISLVAEVILEGALQGVAARLDDEIGIPTARREDGTQGRCGFVILGMGKLGGEELNYSSDIDLIYAYETDEGSAGKTTLHEYCKRLAEALSKAVSEVTEDGFAFRVDLRLRPEGTRGALVNSLRSLESYYESFGRTWERAALLKARPVAGDIALGERLLASLAPYIYRRSLDLRQLNEIRDLNREIKRDLHRKGGPAWDVKLGRGGIREIEFFVQALQLVYAGREARLRERGTLRALTRLVYAGRLSAREHSSLREAYLFFRRVEHRIQLWRERQTHAIPTAPDDLHRLALGLGFASPEAFFREIESHRAKVTQIFETLFSDDPAASSLASGGLSDAPLEVEVLLQKNSTRAERVAALSVLSFGEPEAAERLLAQLEKYPLSPFSPSAPREFARLAPGLVTEASRSPDPDKALVHLTGFLRQAGGMYLKLFVENPTLGRLLLHLFGTSDLLSDAFIRDPGLLEVLLSAGRAELRRGAARLSQLAEARCRGLSDLEDRLRALRRFHREEILRIALHDVGGELDWVVLQEELSDLAEVLVQACFAEAWREDQAARSGEAAPMAVLGLGKLGGRELGYKSDLDLIFLYDGESLDVERCAKIAQRTIFFLSARLEEGGLYEIDTRLRPSGRQGALVASLDGFARYHGETQGAGQQAQLWEEQALLRARPVAGDAGVQARAQEIISRVARRARDAAHVRQELRRMRRRMEEEIPRRGTVHLKASPGGLVDIEFLAQGLQLIHGATSPDLLSTNTRLALSALARGGFLPEEHARSLRSAYEFLGRLSSRVRLLYDQGSDEVRDTPQAWRGVARSLGISSPEALQADLAQHRRLVRASLDALLPA